MYMNVRPRCDNVILIETQLGIYVAKTYQLEQRLEREREREREIVGESNTTVTVYRLCSSLFLA